MHASLLRRTGLIAAIGLLLVAADRLLAQPEVFEDVGVHEAIKRTAGNDSILIVKATAVWCGPCKRMDATTWVDDSVVEWVRANGMATQFDVDEQPELARELRIQAMPTMIAFKDGKEFDRIVGYRDAAGLLAWGRDVKAGTTALEKTRKAAGPRPVDGEGRVDVRARYRLAEELQRAGRYEESLHEYLWLWHNMLDHQPSMSGVRTSFMTSDMGELARAYEPARKAFGKERDKVAEALQTDEGRTWDNLLDWYELSEVIDDQQAILDWFDRIKQRENAAPTLDYFSLRLKRILLDHERYKDLAYIRWDPASDLAGLAPTLLGERALPRGIDEEQKERLRNSSERYWVDKAGGLVVAAILGEQPRHVGKIFDVCERQSLHIDATQMLVEAALRGNAAHPSLIAELDAEIPESDEARADRLKKLRERVVNALEN